MCSLGFVTFQLCTCCRIGFSCRTFDELSVDMFLAWIWHVCKKLWTKTYITLYTCIFLSVLAGTPGQGAGFCERRLGNAGFVTAMLYCLYCLIGCAAFTTITEIYIRYFCYVNAVWDRRRATAGLSNGQCFGLACKGAGRRSPIGIAGVSLLCISFHLFACNFFVWCPNWTIYDSMRSRWCVLLGHHT